MENTYVLATLRKWWWLLIVVAAIGGGGAYFLSSQAVPEAVSAFLDHSSLAVTTTYLRRLEGQRDSAWIGVAQAIGAD